MKRYTSHMFAVFLVAHQLPDVAVTACEIQNVLLLVFPGGNFHLALLASAPANHQVLDGKRVEAVEQISHLPERAPGGSVSLPAHHLVPWHQLFARGTVGTHGRYEA